MKNCVANIYSLFRNYHADQPDSSDRATLNMHSIFILRMRVYNIKKKILYFSLQGLPITL